MSSMKELVNSIVSIVVSMMLTGVILAAILKLFGVV